MTQIAGKRDQLVGRIQERYGIKKEEVEKQLADFDKQQAQYAATKTHTATK